MEPAWKMSVGDIHAMNPLANINLELAIKFRYTNEFSSGRVEGPGKVAIFFFTW